MESTITDKLAEHLAGARDAAVFVDLHLHRDQPIITFDKEG
jgi:hypothetical protein